MYLPKLIGFCLDSTAEKKSNRNDFEKVKRTVVCGGTENGGLRMIDVRQMQLSVLLQWAVRLCQLIPVKSGAGLRRCDLPASAPRMNAFVQM